MAAIDPKVIQELLDQIDELKRAIETAGNEGRNKLKSIKVDEVRQEVPLTTDGKLDAAAWSSLGEDKQQDLYHGLAIVRASLYAAGGIEGPTDPKHIMYADYASNAAIIVWALIGFLLTASLLFTIALRWNKGTGTDFTSKTQVAVIALTQLDAAKDKMSGTAKALEDVKQRIASAKDEKTREEAEQEAEVLARYEKTQRGQMDKAEQEANRKAVKAIQAIREGGATEGAVLTMVVLLGALGGSLHLVASLVMFVGNRLLKRSWLLYYLAMPILGAGLAAIVYMLLRVGILNPSVGSAEGSGTANLNLIAIYAFAALTGLFARKAMDKLGEIFRTIFRTSDEPPSKDGLGSEKPPGGAPTAAKPS